jgi:hypothetical protein
MGKLNIFLEFWGYIKTRRKWWLIPIIFFLLLAALLIITKKSSLVAPFVYAIF